MFLCCSLFSYCSLKTKTNICSFILFVLVLFCVCSVFRRPRSSQGATARGPSRCRARGPAVPRSGNTYTYIYIYIYIYIHTCSDSAIFIYIYIYIYLFFSLSLSLSIYLFLSLYIYIYIYIGNMS